MPDVDLNNSRSLDVHRWSDHPEANKFVDEVWHTYFDRMFEKQGRGKRPKSDHKIQLKVLLLDLYVSWMEDPLQFVGVGMSKRFYRAGSRYNALHISEIMIELVRYSEFCNLIELHKGNESSGRVTRIRPIGDLVSMFLEAKLSEFDVGSHNEREVIILNESDSSKTKNKRKASPLEYNDDDNPEIPRMREELQRYNDLLRNSFIDIPTLEEPFISQETTNSSKYDNNERVIRIGQHNKFVRRIFYRGSWNLGGRFHGGWWQLVGSSWRKVIHINDDSTTEIDYKGLHINLLYGLRRETPPDDPYHLDSHVVDGIVKPEVPRSSNLGFFDNRKMVKQLILIAINTVSEKATFQAFRSEQPTGSRLKKLTDKLLLNLLNAFREKNPFISDYLCTDQGVKLMHLDGKITANLIKHFTDKNIPILTIHDSYLIQRKYGAELREVMRYTVKELLGGFEIQVDEEDQDQDMYFRFRDKGVPFEDRGIERKHPIFHDTKGYLSRMDLFNKWLASQ